MFEKILFLLLVLVGMAQSIFNEKSGVGSIPSSSYARDGTDYIQAEEGYRIYLSISNYKQSYTDTYMNVYDKDTNAASLIGRLDYKSTDESVLEFYSASTILYLTYNIHKYDSGYTFEYKQIPVNSTTNGTYNLFNDVCNKTQYMHKNSCYETVLFDATTNYTEALKSCRNNRIATITDIETQKAVGEATDVALQFKKTHRVDPFRIYVGGEYLAQNNDTGIYSAGYYWNNGTVNVPINEFVWEQGQPIQQNMESNTTTSVHLAYNWHFAKVAQTARLHTVKCTENECSEDVRGIACVYPKIRVVNSPASFVN